MFNTLHKNSSSPVFAVIVVLISFGLSCLVDVSVGECSVPMRNRMGLNSDFGVLIDAGSTGTRVWIYSWPRSLAMGDDKLVNGTIPPIKCAYSYKEPKGLAEVADDLIQLRGIVLTLIKKAEEQIPNEIHKATSIFLMATAGMRLLLEDKAILLVEELDSLLRNKTLNPFMYDSPHNTRILSGEEEGVFAWIAVNYLSKRLTNIDGDLYKTTSGILELGGASTQIAFIPRGSVLSDKFPVFIGGEKYPIYVHSYLHYGQDYVDKWIHNRLAHDQSHLNTSRNPCMLKGETLETPDGRTLVGTGNPSECVALLEKFIYKNEPHRCHPKPCAIGSVYQPNIPPNQTFYTIGAFYFIIKDLKVINEDGIFTPVDVYKAAFNYCSKDFKELIQELKPSEISKKFVSKPCSIGLFTSLLFTRGYGFKNDTQQIMAVEKINGHPIDWTLGALIYENDYRMTSQCSKNTRLFNSIIPGTSHATQQPSSATSASVLIVVPLIIPALCMMRTLLHIVVILGE